MNNNNFVATLRLSRRNLLAILAGLVVIVITGIITSVISFFMTLHIFSLFPVSDIQSAYLQQPYITYSWILRTISFLSPILGGFIVGWLAKKKGWLYGGILGILLRLISLSFATVIFLLPSSLIYGPNFPPDFRKEENLQSILNILLYSPITILKTALGGYLGEHFKVNSSLPKVGFFLACL